MWDHSTRETILITLCSRMQHYAQFSASVDISFSPGLSVSFCWPKCCLAIRTVRMLRLGILHKVQNKKIRSKWIRSKLLTCSVQFLAALEHSLQLVGYCPSCSIVACVSWSSRHKEVTVKSCMHIFEWKHLVYSNCLHRWDPIGTLSNAELVHKKSWTMRRQATFGVLSVHEAWHEDKS